MRLAWAVIAGLLLAIGATGAQSSHYVGDAAGTAAASVQGSPFSADLITSYDRILDNGGHIRRESQGRIFRDGQGRTRTETEVPAPQAGAEKWERITINDPVRRQVIYLNPKTKSATIYHFGEGMGPTAPLLANNGDLVNQQPSTQKPQKNSGKAVKQGSSIRFGTGVAPNAPIATGAMNGPIPLSNNSDIVTRGHTAVIHTTPVEGTTESLGTRKIAGVMAAGTRTTRSVEGGTMGSGKPIVTVTETWISPELNTVVLTSTDDGEEGRSVMKLVNIRRAEPDSQLFQIPPDYTVKENQH